MKTKTEEDPTTILAEAKQWQQHQQELLAQLRAKAAVLESALSQVNAAILDLTSAQRPHVIAGSLSARIAEILSHSPARLRDIREQLMRNGGFRDNTVVSVCLSRLADKGVIRRGDDARWRLANNFGGVLTRKESVKS